MRTGVNTSISTATMSATAATARNVVTRYLLDGRPEHVVETALMWDFVAATVAGVVAGLLFEYYFRRRARGADRTDVEVPDS